ncbi:urease accessory protein UreD, partial [Azospirillum brasilense]|uniref:urease accessory protein UreD n=1 Tax=Azospirillum brasilense TaxID=192 RepID=UPI0027DC4B0D
MADALMKKVAVHGAATVRFEHRHGATRLATLYHHDPLRVLLPDPRAGDLPIAVLVTTSGGLVGGDRLDVALSAGPGAAAPGTTQAAGEGYPPAGAARRQGPAGSARRRVGGPPARRGRRAPGGRAGVSPPPPLLPGAGGRLPSLGPLLAPPAPARGRVAPGVGGSPPLRSRSPLPPPPDWRHLD